MSEKDDFEDQLSGFDVFAEAFNKDDDPLETFDEKFKKIDVDPTEMYKKTRLQRQNITNNRIQFKIGVIEEWKEYMLNHERHVACPSTRHVAQYIDNLLDEDLTYDYVKQKINIISNMFEYLNDHPKLPHGTGEAMGYNPVETALTFKKEEIKSKTNEENKRQHKMDIEEIAHHLRQIKNRLHRTVILTQFKFGLRGGQVRNIQIPDVKIDHAELKELYPSLGTHRRLRDFEEDTIYLAPTNERPGVKSERPIVMPIDWELKHLLIKYLRQRPPIEESWLFVNNANGNKLTTDYINTRMWKPVFHPKYDETDQFKAVTAHFARHRFGTYWRKEIGLNPELIKYMRGDKQDNRSLNLNQDVLDNYVHAYYDDIKDIYRADIYKFNL